MTFPKPPELMAVTTEIASNAPVEERTGSAPASDRRHRPWSSPSVAAIIAYVLGTGVALVLPAAVGFSGYDLRAWTLALAYGFACLLVVAATAIWRRRASDALAGVTAGLFGSWITMILGSALRGTPFGFYGLVGDAGRVTAMATRYSVTWHSADAIIPGLPSEYPPLFAWVVGRTSVLLDFPAWRLVGKFEIVVTGLAVLAGFLLWQRLVPAWPAVLTTVFSLLIYGYPGKAYEVIALIVFVPWALATFGRPPRGRLPWYVGGAIGGLLIMTYYGWIVFGGLGLLAIVVATARSEPDRRRYLLHVGRTILTAAVVASPFLVPLGYAKLTTGGATVADLYGDGGFLSTMFPFFEPTVLGLVQLVGLVGLVVRLRSSWWAPPLLLLVVGEYLYRCLGTLSFLVSQHTLLAQYAQTMVLTTLAIAGVLTVVETAPNLLRRLAATDYRRLVAVAVTLVLAWAGYSYTHDWMPASGGAFSSWTAHAFAEPLPDGTYVASAGGRDQTPWFPVDPIKDDVTRVLGPNPRAVTLSVDERLFSYLPWPGYTWDDLGGSLAHSFERVAQVRTLAGIRDPAAFADASRHTAYGPIDIFVLKISDGGWVWVSHMGYNHLDAVITFQPAQFDRATWFVDDQLPGGYVVAVRRP